MKAQDASVDCHISRKDSINTLSTYVDVIKGAQNPIGAQLFINHVLNPKMQALFASKLNTSP